MSMLAAHPGEREAEPARRESLPAARISEMAFLPVLVIPIYNHAGTIVRVVEEVRQALAEAGRDAPVVLVNDGSTDGTAAALERMTGVTVLAHERNLGKGAALRTAFKYAVKHGFSHGVTVDADGQHDPADVLGILAAAEEHREDLIIGQRDMEDPAVPRASRKGRDASRFWFRILTGRDVSDTQCGLRAYPLNVTLAVPQRFHRYDFETEILARLSWGEVKLRHVPVRCIYFSQAERVTHFRPVADTVRGVWANFFLVVRRLMPWPFKRLVSGDDHAVPRFGAWWKWASWKKAVIEAMSAGSSQSELSLAFAMGIFVGLTPFYMLQTILAIYFARRLHLNVLAAVIGSQISIPPLAPIWATLSYAVGHFLLTGRWGLSQFTWSTQALWPFLLGNVVVALVTATAGLLIARGVLYCFRGTHQY